MDRKITGTLGDLILGCAPRRSRGTRRRLTVECLEVRMLPAVLFGTHPAVTVSDGQGPVIDRPAVDLIFWGSGWASNLDLLSSMDSAVNSILTGPYLSGLTQYRPEIVGSGLRVRTDLITETSPGASFTDDGVGAMLRDSFRSGRLPSPESDSNLYYCVVAQPGSLPPEIAGHTFQAYENTNFHFGCSSGSTYLVLQR